MKKEENVINYYLICNKLKDIIRTGWNSWHIKRERVESIAEHVYGVQMLAIAMKSEYEYDIDIMKVIYMLAIHELGEAIIGDITPFSSKIDTKVQVEHQAVHNILAPLIDGEQIEKLFLEFDARETKEALFAYQCDKLECDIQCKLYDQEGCVDLNNQEGNESLSNPLIREFLDKGLFWSEIWIKYGQNKYPYDEHFMAVSKYIENNNIGNNE